ncbi:ABC transporter permease [Paenibacillus oenotherae]|uniref:ABC transporter permease n=1 Tax=Paenibacillus oenotherae TaxID=1435645 RepID=A0ABS7D9Y7_9BACL|nr:ABC transporter permease [Paenibacillus oenotherae]MBW7476750.1 ABC transporter permease [Paenibacillus oenotherae]
MFNFWQLVRNENLKIYSRIQTWFMIGFIVILQIGLSALLKFIPSEFEPISWAAMFEQTYILFFFIAIFTVVVAANSVANEFSSGTIKLLLIRPWSRSKILLSKYVSILLFGLLLGAIMFVLTLGVNLLLFPFDNSNSVVHESFGSVRDMRPIEYILLYYGNKFIELVMLVTISFMMSAVFRSSVLAIVLSLLILTSGMGIARILFALGYEWVDYVLFLHMNFVPYLDGAPRKEEFTLPFSMAVYGVYYVIFIATTWFIFNKRDVSS